MATFETQLKIIIDNAPKILAEFIEINRMATKVNVIISYSELILHYFMTCFPRIYIDRQHVLDTWDKLKKQNDEETKIFDSMDHFARTFVYSKKEIAEMSQKLEDNRQRLFLLQNIAMRCQFSTNTTIESCCGRKTTIVDGVKVDSMDAVQSDHANRV